MDSPGIPDIVIAEIMDGAVDRETIASLWSVFVAPGGTPEDTLRDATAPGYAPPEIFPKTVAFPGERMPGADYAIVSRLGEGGMGVVFEARQNHLARTVALKMIRPERAGDPLARNCFFQRGTLGYGDETIQYRLVSGKPVFAI